MQLSGIHLITLLFLGCPVLIRVGGNNSLPIYHIMNHDD